MYIQTVFLKSFIKFDRIAAGTSELNTLYCVRARERMTDICTYLQYINEPIKLNDGCIHKLIYVKCVRYSNNYCGMVI
jgi:hypothetical protein